MTQFNEALLERIVAACSENAAAIAESLNLCFERNYRIAAGERRKWNAENASTELDQAGLTVAIGIGGQAMLCFIPESLPLPEWYKAPRESEQSRLQTLSLEWSMNMLPADVAADEFEAIASDDLKQLAAKAALADGAALLELLVFEESVETGDADGGGDTDETTPAPATDESAADPEAVVADAAQAVARLYLIVPVNRPPFSAGESPAAAAGVSTSGQAAAPTPAALRKNNGIERQMLELPVTVSVRLAEKRIELGQLTSITPGGLITFGKGCESLLDLYVNNHLYGRGEAIKVGEKFGLKVTEVGIRPERPRHVF